MMTFVTPYGDRYRTKSLLARWRASPLSLISEVINKQM